MTRMSSPLFDYEIPVSEAEVEAWLDQVPNLSALKSRRKAYRRCHPCFSYRKLWLMSKVAPVVWTEIYEY
jgi:hypothetical protein